MAGETADATPDEELEDDQADDTPEGEPVDEVEPEEPADQSAAEPDSRYAQAEYTRSQQAFSSLKDVLGLDKKATRQDVIAAVEALRSQPAAAADEGEEDEDPRITEANERAWNAELALQTAIYGEEFTGAMRDVVNVARTTNDPAELVQAFAAFAMDYGVTLAGTAEAADEAEEEADEDGAAALDIGPSEGDRGPSARQAVDQSARRRDSGVTGAIRDIFAAAGVGSRET